MINSTKIYLTKEILVRKSNSIAMKLSIEKIENELKINKA
jgi:hypothetical protein